ncbi:hypothetical protein HZB00_01040 [Candidatus Woesearchaeota archaeon]|nr:hypothetical protein [Candidatus Woesearchaeota archaeon]
MIQQSYESIVSKIVAAAKLSPEQVEEKVQKKLADLNDLVSKEGAAHIVANDLGVSLFESVPARASKIKDLRPGMGNVEVSGRIITLYEPRSFQKNGRAGKVMSFTLGDETESVRVAVWDENLIQEIAKCKEGDVIKIKNAYVKENNIQRPEVHIGNKAQIVINPIEIAVRKENAVKRKQLGEAVENEVIETIGFIVQVFEPKSYNACPVCNKKVLPEGVGFKCMEHQVVVPKQVPIFNFTLDDSSAAMRVVCFRDVAQSLLGTETDFAKIKANLLGKPLLIKGKVVKNQMMDRTELIANVAEEPDPAQLIAELNPK